ncbi:MAG: ribokinase [Angelakisella sp.]|nr:ribokinase [Angelakisella sp.]
MGKKILVIGSLNMDMVIPVKELPQKGETILGGSPAHIPGGKGANQACAAGKLGGAVTMLGKVGQDGMGRALKENLAAAGVEVTHVEETPDAPTGMAVIYVGETGSNSIVVIPGANGLCDAAFIEANEELIAAHDIIVLQLEIPYDGVFRAIQLAKKHGRLVVLNPAPAPDSLPPEVIASLDYFTPNETEMARIAGLPVGGVEEAIAAGKKLVEAGVGTVLATLGEAGALLVTKETAQVLPTLRVQAVDTTAAGDTFNGAFVTALAEGMSQEEAIAFGNKAASISVTRKGAQTSIPSREEVDGYRP